MRRATFFLLVFLCGSWSFILGQTAPKFTTPRIVATLKLLNQTAPIPPTAIFTPKHWGTFRVSTVMVETQAQQGFGLWNEWFRWKDASGTSDEEIASLGAGGKDNAYGSFVARLKAGEPLQFYVVSSDAGGKYNVWVVVEQLM